MAESESIVTLHQQLDNLWVRYLTLVDQYAEAQALIKTSLARGFFSLAQANFTSSGRRYGQDYYDQRAIASTKAQFCDDGDVLRVKITNIHPHVKTKKEIAPQLPTPEPEVEDLKAESEPTQVPTPELEEEEEEEDDRPEEIIEKDHHEEMIEEDQTRLPSDPLRQFGILIPHALRSAQKSFTKAVHDHGALSKAVDSARAMRDVEIEIRKARKVLKKAEKDGGRTAAS